MSEQITEVHTFLIHLICDECGGKMLPTGIMLLSDPPIYPHKCNICNTSIEIREFKYPKTMYKEVKV